MSSISRDVVKKLIERYENYSELYNVQHTFYKNKTKRQECFNIITKEVNEVCGISLTVEDVKKKINGLRTQFFTEISKEKKSATSGKGSNELYKSNWWCFELLYFLKNSAPVQHGESNLKTGRIEEPIVEATGEMVDNNTEIIYDGSVEELPRLQFAMLSSEETSTSNSEVHPFAHAETPKNKRKKCTTQQNQSYHLLNKATAALEQVNDSSAVDDHFDSFGKLIATELRRIKNPATLNRIKRDVMNLIFDTLDEELHS